MTRAWILTPQPGLGELIREALHDFGVEAVVSNEAPPEALSEGQQPFDLLVLDGDIAPPDALQALAKRWRAQMPEGKLVCIAPESATAEWQEAMCADLWLDKPFYLPDLTDALARLLKNEPAPPTTGHAKTAEPPLAQDEAATLPPPPPWLADVTLAAQHLARLSLETAAQAAALVSREGELWAYAGELPQPAAAELARLVAHYWGVDGDSDFVRFVRLEAVQQDFLLYATPVAATLALAMVFEADTPFTRIRSQANRLAEALIRQAPEAPSEAAAPPQPAEADELPPAEAWPPDELDDDDDEMEAEVMTEDFEEALPPEASLPLFDEVPPPVPDVEEAPAVNGDTAEAEDATAAPTVAVNVVSAPPQTGPRGYAAPSDPTMPVAVARPLAEEPEAAAVSAPEDATLPPPATFARAELFYASVLIPRFPQDHLAGDLARDLGQWMPRIVMSFGWHLVHLAVRPNYLQWIVQVLPATSPADMLRLVRQHTSRYIFTNYPRIAEHHVGDDFWAPGYLMLSQNKLVPTPTIEAFIRQIRRRQGMG